MNRKLSGRRKPLVLAALLLFPLLSVMVSVWSEVADGTEKKRADILELRLPEAEKPSRMPPVWFLHDQHTGALPEKGCTACHPEEKDRLAFEFKNAEALDYQAAMALYHGECGGCHRELKTGGRGAGPLVGKCRSCHKKEPGVESAWIPLEFDRALHYRHVRSDRIAFGENDKNCGACHHVYDEKLEKTVYREGEEGSCRYCHKEQKTDETRSYRNAAHASCVACHKRLADKQLKAGPVECAGCHSREGQAGIKTPGDVPRMKAGQPDAVLMASWIQDAAKTELPEQLTRPVAFNHKGHEPAVTSCRQCHHASLESCHKCHKIRGAEEGGFVTLQTAMHAGDSNTSCVGCHNDMKEKPDCAGCHAPMQTTFADRDCGQCHSIDPQTLQPLPIDPERRKQIAATAISGRRQKPEMVPDRKIPEKVEIGILADAYEPAAFPHRKIVHALAEKVGKSRLATVFHEKSETLCMGCHHNSPPSLKPPRCVSCHKPAGPRTDPDRPLLKGAYHGQCIGCHQQMGIEKPAATDCKACHKPKMKTEASELKRNSSQGK